MAHGRPQIRVLQNESALHWAAAERFVELAVRAIEQHGTFHVALAGGSTPQGMYSLLATPDFSRRLDWSRVLLYFGDERIVPPDHDDSNYRMVRISLLDRLAVAPAAVHRIPGELPPEQAANNYAEELRQYLPASGFDLVLLGMGPDGHIASLFPGSDALNKRKASTAALYVPKLDSWRVTLTLPVLNKARNLLLLVSGARKADVVRHVLRNINDAMPLPVQLLRPEGDQEWLLDAAAASHLERRQE